MLSVRIAVSRASHPLPKAFSLGAEDSQTRWSKTSAGHGERDMTHRRRNVQEPGLVWRVRQDRGLRSLT